jgi:dUTP pyrophosphatase
MIRFLPNHFSSKMPSKATPGSAGFDVYSAEELTIPAGKRSLVDSGFSMAFGGDMYARIAPRSGLAVRGIDVGAGVIDSDYRGPVKVLIINNSSGDFKIQVGDRIAQMIFEAYVKDASFQLVTTLETTERGSGGFGSTGMQEEVMTSQKQREQAKMFQLMYEHIDLQ